MWSNILKEFDIERERNFNWGAINGIIQGVYWYSRVKIWR
jgi:hypothetical protein